MRFLIHSVFKICTFEFFFRLVPVPANLTLEFCHLPIKKMMWLSLFLSYTASILFVSGGRPIQKFWIRAGLLDTNDPSLLILQNCAPLAEKGTQVCYQCRFGRYCQLQPWSAFFVLWKLSCVHYWQFPLTFKEENFSPDIRYSVKASLTAFVKWGVRPGTERFPVILKGAVQSENR